jgi:hypothetical protein
MNSRNILFCRNGYLLIALVIMLGCEKERELREFPGVLTTEVTNITRNKGATFNAELTLFGSGSVEQHGFVWGISTAPALGSSDAIFLGSTTQSGQFTNEVQSALVDSAKYHVRAFAISNGFTVYGNAVSFISLGGSSPQLNDIYPPSASMGDTLFIIGQNFSLLTELTQVMIGEVTTVPVYSAQDTLGIIVPKELKVSEPAIRVKILENLSNEITSFKLKPPTIYEITPKTVFSGNTTILIQGNNFLKDSTKVYFGELPVSVVNSYYYYESDEITVKVPSGLPYGYVPIKVQVSDQYSDNLDSVFNDAPAILSIDPILVTNYDTISIKGNQLKDSYSASIGGIAAPIIYKDDSLVKVAVPGSLNTHFADVQLTVYNGNYRYDLGSRDSVELKAPDIFSVSPNEAFFGDTLTITGKNFTPGSLVFINNEDALVLSNTPDSINVKIPVGVDEDLTIRVESAGRNLSYTENIILLKPSVATIDKVMVSVGDTIELRGVFPRDRGSFLLEVDGTTVTNIVESNTNFIRFEVPVPDFNQTDHELSLTYGSLKVPVGQIIISHPLIQEVLVAPIGHRGFLKYKVDIATRYYDEVEFWIGGYNWQPYSISADTFIYKMDKLIPSEYYQTKFRIGKKDFDQPTRVLVPWQKIYEKRVEAYGGAGSGWFMNVSDRIFKLKSNEGRNGFEVYEYFPANDTEIRKNDLVFSGAALGAFPSMSLNNTGLAGFYSSQGGTSLWSYNPDDDIWTKKIDLPIKFYGGFAFKSEGKIIIGSGLIRDTTDAVSKRNYVWEYNLNANSLSDLPEPPFSGHENYRSLEVEGRSFIVGGKIAEDTYSKELWEFNPSGSSWIPRAPFPGTCALATVFSHGGYAYVGGGCKDNYWIYDPATDFWKKFASPGEYISKGEYDWYFESNPITIGQSTYIYFTHMYWAPGMRQYLSLWKFDSSKF